MLWGMERRISPNVIDMPGRDQRLLLQTGTALIVAGGSRYAEYTAVSRSDKSIFGAKKDAILCLVGYVPSTVSPRLSQLFALPSDSEHWDDRHEVERLTAEIARFNDMVGRSDRQALLFGGYYDPRNFMSTADYTRMVLRCGELVRAHLDIPATVAHPPKNDANELTTVVLNNEEGRLKVAQSSRVTPSSRESFPADQIYQYRQLWDPRSVRATA